MKELTAFINYHTIDSFDSLEPWLHMKGDSFIIFFQSLRQGFFQNSFIDFWRTTKSSVHIYRNLTHKDFLWNFEKEKITQLVPDIYSTSVLSQAYCNRKNHVVLHQMNGGQIHNTRGIYLHPEHKHFCSIKPSNHMQLVLHTRGNLDWLMYTMYIKASSNMCIQSIWKGSIII